MFYLKLKYEVDKMSIMENEVDGVVVGEGGGGSETLARGYSIFSGRRNIVDGGGQSFSEGDLSNFWFNRKVSMKNLM